MAITPRLRPPFRAEHVGSLVRPAALLAARYPADGSAPVPAALRRLEDEHVAAVIRFQERIGLQVITDGEFRRASWRLGLVDKVAGFERAEALGDVDVQYDDDGNARRIGSAPLAVAPIRRGVPIAATEVAFVAQRTDRTVKATLPAPSYLHYPRGDRCFAPGVYPDVDAFFDDVLRLYQEEVAAIHAAGGRYLQLDEVTQALLCDDAIRDKLRARGDDPDALSMRYVDLVNRIVGSAPDDMTIAVHLCRGNAMGNWMASGSYERVAERVFAGIEAHAFFLEYDSERAGSFEPLRFVPEDKIVVLGLVSTKTPRLENRDDLARRIDAAAAFVPHERLCLSPQCGFASADVGAGLTAEDQAAKLRLVVETASTVWGE